ncbi:protein NRT1/ PTR FAMILY 8.1-like [Senna tora]|uniref:Protein NRT1/ PTR FAMILY 8.1-like n=1 Tax=Senna tora TaxID=362788 RepID=A0A834T680_9FABA|nr:protein NRT1/ PTR FAMILY 8.1-like [Senna tora]
MAENDVVVKNNEDDALMKNEDLNDVYTKDGTVDSQGNPANKNKTGTWKACPFILGNECCERLAYYGMGTNLVLYFKHRLGQEGPTASKNVADWSGTCYITPLIGAFLADAFLGRYWTIASFSIVYVIGMTLLTLSASIPAIKPTCDVDKGNCEATVTQNAVSFLALYLIALGTGGIKPCVSSFGADQFDDADAAEKVHKASFFNWFYFSINIGALIAASLLVWIQENVGWGLGFGIPAVAMAIAVVSFFSGTRLYRHQKPGGSPLTRLCQVVVASVRKYKVEVPEESKLLYEIDADTESAIQGSRKLDHTNGLSFFDKAAVKEEASDAKGPLNPWTLCTVTQVEEFKAILRLLPVWATGIIFATVYGQMSNYFVLQGETMDTRISHSSSFQIPAASLSIFDTLSVIFWVPIYDRLITPLAARFTGRPNGLSQLQRMGVGLFISIFSVLFAGVLELVRLNLVKRHDLYKQEELLPISIFWQVPQYFIIGCAEVFTFIGQLEFFYEQAPDAMRSVCSALSLLTVALGQYVSSLLVTIVTKATTTHGGPGWLPDKLNYADDVNSPLPPALSNTTRIMHNLSSVSKAPHFNMVSTLETITLHYFVPPTPQNIHMALLLLRPFVHHPLGEFYIRFNHRRFTFTHRFVNQCCFDGILLLYLCPFTVLQELKVLDLAERHGESSLTFAHVGLK